MILTGPEIRKQVEAGRIVLSPFDSARLNPNSYNYRLAPELLLPHDDRCMMLPGEGMVLRPRTLYLGSTVEVIGSSHYVPTLIGRSSIGRLGIFVQISADLGNLGPAHCWTLEITVVQHVRVYPGMVLGQVCFWVPVGARDHAHVSPYTRHHSAHPAENDKVQP